MAKQNKNPDSVPLARVAQLMSLGVGYHGVVILTSQYAVKIAVDVNRKIEQYKKAPKNSRDITPFELGVEWLTGIGPKHRNFKQGDYLTELLRQHKHIQEAKQEIKDGIKRKKLITDNVYRDPYELKGIQGVGLYVKDYSTLATGGLTGNLAVTFLGSYRMKYTITEITPTKAKVVFVVTNSSSMQSASRPPVIGYLDVWKNTVGKKINETFETGWGSTTTQTITWYEEIDLD